MKLRIFIVIACCLALTRAAHADPLPGTAPLELQGDLADQMVSGIDKFLLREIEQSVDRRARLWTVDKSSFDKYNQSVAPNRARLARILGAHDARVHFSSPQLLATTAQPALVGRGSNYDVFAIRWPAVRGVHGEGLLLVPRDAPPKAEMIVVPDADQTPEQLVGLEAGINAESQLPRRLAEIGCRVIVPALISRANPLSAIGERRTNQPHREFLYRPAFELGRHILGYETQKVLALVDWLAAEKAAAEKSGGEKTEPRPLCLAGYGEGGLIALYCAALDTRIDATLVSGAFDSRQDLWQEPIYRNVFGLLDQFGDAELARLVAPRGLVIEACGMPRVAGPEKPRDGQNASAAPGRIQTPDLKRIHGEIVRANALVEGLRQPRPCSMVASGDGFGPFFSPQAVGGLLAHIGRAKLKVLPPASSPENLLKTNPAEAREHRLFDEINADTQHLLRESEYVRQELWSKADRGSRDPEKFLASTRTYRDHFYNEVIGRFDQPLLPANPRSRLVYDETLYTGYEVTLDVFPDVFAYGILLVPKNMKADERRPVVVCQHGLEGRPTDVADPKKFNASYNQYACRLAEQGFIVFAPQNPYIFTDRFRSLQRKANPLGKTLYSIIVPQHQQIVDWLATLPNADPERIAFYGLSYGGKTAMRVPALVERYCLSICSADFNEWIWKNASTRSNYSYVATGEYEIFEFDLGNTYNYAEMAALIAPRPFMVERGHHDGVAPDPWVAYEFAKVRLLYSDLKIADRTTIEFFDGPHTIHGVGTFEFLHKHLNWPAQLNR